MKITRKTIEKIFIAKRDSCMTWDEIAAKAKIPTRSWMTGVPYDQPTEAEVRKIAPVLNTTFEDLVGDK